MNKTQAEYVQRAADKTKKCVLGKLEESINKRLPKKPRPLDAWQKYERIRNGDASLITTFTPGDLITQYSSKNVLLVDAFIYAVTPEEEAYKKATEAIAGEKADRELAVELAFLRAVDECVLGHMTTEEFLNHIEKLAQQEW